ncbi:hypothetical protein APA_2680 [Pseudanabaena sp. lw0831]|nr:hypothetical protein APA_2680 [Pseudanabaena sp. lw0831]
MHFFWRSGGSITGLGKHCIKAYLLEFARFLTIYDLNPKSSGGAKRRHYF